MEHQTPAGLRTTAPHVIVADDDKDLRALISNALRSKGFAVLECAHGAELLLQIEGLLQGDSDHSVRCIVSDIRMPGVTGMSVLEGLRGAGCSVPVFLITAFGSRETHANARSLGAVRTFNKPFDIDELVHEVTKLIGAP